MFVTVPVCLLLSLMFVVWATLPELNCFDMIWIVSCKQISFDFIWFIQFWYCFVQRSQSACIL